MDIPKYILFKNTHSMSIYEKKDIEFYSAYLQYKRIETVYNTEDARYLGALDLCFNKRVLGDKKREQLYKIFDYDDDLDKLRERAMLEVL